ncbi:hypothetical protein ACFW7J_22490 [Streptomyces sp. NPDC059525]|uniref:hypothetical protein n=1 Tax=Streptomyces sp. NPDC059525 TaxID=3346857 RepID=UPI0036A7A9A9
MGEAFGENGPHTASLSPSPPAPPKTGTAEQDRAAWFAGYTPDLVTVVSIMGQDPDTGTLQPLYGALGEPRLGGGGYPARIWAAYTKKALDGTEPVDFDLELQPGAAQPPPPVQPTTPQQPQGSRPPWLPDQTGRPNPPNGGQTNAGQNNGGQTNGGQNTGGQTQGGQTNGGQNTGGQTNAGQNNGGQTNGGQTTGGQTTGGETTGGGETNGGQTTGGLTPRRRPPSLFLE